MKLIDYHAKIVLTEAERIQLRKFSKPELAGLIWDHSVQSSEADGTWYRLTAEHNLFHDVNVSADSLSGLQLAMDSFKRFMEKEFDL